MYMYIVLEVCSLRKRLSKLFIGDDPADRALFGAFGGVLLKCDERATGSAVRRATKTETWSAKNATRARINECVRVRMIDTSRLRMWIA